MKPWLKNVDKPMAQPTRYLSVLENPLDMCSAVKFLAANKICTDDADAEAPGRRH